MRANYIAGLILTSLLLSIMSCTHVISKEAREIAVKDIPFQWIAENPERYRGAFVIWGGEILDSKTLGEGTLIEVLQRPLARSEKPDKTKNSNGRFLVLYEAGFPPVFRKGSKITVAGIVEGQKTLQMGGAVRMGKVNYSYPYLMAKEVYIWEDEGMMNQYEYPYY